MKLKWHRISYYINGSDRVAWTTPDYKYQIVWELSFKSQKYVRVLLYDWDYEIGCDGTVKALKWLAQEHANGTLI